MDKRQQRIVIINRFLYPDVSGSSQQLTGLAFHLAASGWEVTGIASRGLTSDPSVRLAKTEVVNSVNFLRVWSSSLGRRWFPGRVIDYVCFYLLCLVALVSRVRPGTIVLVDSDPPLFFIVAAAVARRRGGRLVHRVGDLYPDVAEAVGLIRAKGVFANAIRAVRNRALKRVDKIIVYGEGVADRLVEAGCDRAAVRVITGCEDGDMVRPIPPSQNALRREWNLTENFVVGYSGNMGRAHEFDTLLGAAAAISERHEVVFLFVGDGAQKKSIERKVQERGLANVSFKPYQAASRLGETLGVADVHIVSLRPEFEGMIVPSKFMSIAAAGRPTIFVGCPDGEIAQLLKQASCGHAVRVGDFAGLTKQLKLLAADAELRRQEGANARALFEARFEKRMIMAAWEAALGDE